MVAEEGYEGFQRNQRVVITGGRNKMLANLAPLMPRRTLLSMVVVPTLLMPGDQDLQAPPWVMRRQLAHIPGAEFIVLPEASHSINWEQPEAFNRHILEFIGKH